jgi:hypothetical protein
LATTGQTLGLDNTRLAVGGEATAAQTMAASALKQAFET